MLQAQNNVQKLTVTYYYTAQLLQVSFFFFEHDAATDIWDMSFSVFVLSRVMHA